MRLSDVAPREAFALLGPGFSGEGWLLVRGLRPASDGPGVWFAAYETGGADAMRLTGDVFRIDLELDVPSAPLAVRLDEEHFLRSVGQIREAIAAGDVYQVNLTLRAEVHGAGGPEIFAALCRRGTPRFAAWIRSPWTGELVSASPEMLFEIRGRTLRAEPMKGTAAPDRREALEGSIKDRAELAMITDLSRDDLHQLCEPRSVEVLSPRRVIELPYVVQAVSNVEGTLRPDLGVRDVLAVMHPGGSVTGAPRHAARAMIAALEPTARGAYCGTLVWESGSLARAALLIRTASRVQDDAWLYGVGSGITWDSEPHGELEEVRLKLGALG